KKSAQIREILISESAWEEMTCLFAPSLALENLSLVSIRDCSSSFSALALSSTPVIQPNIDSL
ncbi:hypothetical protein CQA51_26085, partial [Klebsiella pneumoniae]